MSLSVDIEKKLGDFHLKVRFEAENEVLALLGASGCGKSMTLKCISGIEKPDRGCIILDGRTLFDSEKHIDLPPQKRRQRRAAPTARGSAPSSRRACAHAPYTCRRTLKTPFFCAENRIYSCHRRLVYIFCLAPPSWPLLF